MSAEHALQQALISRLRSAAAVAALLGDHGYETSSPQITGVYDYVPQSSASESRTPFPYVVVGDTTGVEFDTDDVNGQEHTVTLHVWDRYRGRTRVRRILDAIYAELHEAELSVSGHHTVLCYWEFSDYIPDPEETIQHAVTRFRITTQQI